MQGLSSGLKIIDYQTPLKARQADSRIGKIDLLGLVGDRLTVIELKAGGGSDSPLRALLEGLAYGESLMPIGWTLRVNSPTLATRSTSQTRPV